LTIVILLSLLHHLMRCGDKSLHESLYKDPRGIEQMTESAWGCDGSDSTSPPDNRAPHFDESLGAWVLSRYADVLAAFNCSSLFPSGLNSKEPFDPPTEDQVLRTRRETRDALSPLHLRVWRKGVASASRALAQRLSSDEPVELISAYAAPLCLSLSAMVTRIDPHEAERIRELAEPIAASAAEPYDASLKSRARNASAKIRSCFRPGPELLRDSGFVALAHTLPCLLANAWLALAESPEQWAVLHREPRLVEHAVEELLRCSGLPRILFRRAIHDIKVNGAHIRKGERIVLKVRAANLDPAHFPQADRLDVKRTRVRHLALGAGSHSCVGAGLIRMAAVSITRPLLERFSSATLAEPIRWKGGSVYRFPESLRVLFNEPLG
jgi:cytochrome P450